jgi:hypothetical protein
VESAKRRITQQLLRDQACGGLPPLQLRLLLLRAPASAQAASLTLRLQQRQNIACKSK